MKSAPMAVLPVAAEAPLRELALAEIPGLLDPFVRLG